MEIKYLIPLIPLIYSLYWAYKWWDLYSAREKWYKEDKPNEYNGDFGFHIDGMIERRNNNMFTWFGITVIVILILVLL